MIKKKNKAILCAIASLALTNSAVAAPLSAMASERTATVQYSATADINLRKTASWSGEIITVVKKGVVVDVISINNGWAKTNYNGNTGYLPTSHLTKVESNNPSAPSTPITKKEMVVKVNDLSVRKGAGTKYTKLGVLNKGDKVVVVEELSNGWVKIEYKTGYGYVSNVKGAYLEEVSTSNPSNPSTPDSLAVKYSATADINFRKTASWSGEIITVVKKGVVVDVISINNGWAKANYNGVTGYLPASHLTKTDFSEPSVPSTPNKPEVSNKKQMVVKVNDLSVRKGAGTKYAKIGSLNKGEVVTVVEELSNGWVKIEHKNGFGYVSNIKGAYLEESKELNDKAAANTVIAMIDALNSSVTLDDMDVVKEARDAYNALNAEAQALVTNLDKLTDAEAEIDRLHVAEIEKLNDIMDKIDLLESIITIDNVVAERAKIDEIDGLIAQVYGPFVQNISNLRELEAIRAEVEKVESNMAEAKKVSDMIQALDSRIITINDKDEIKNVRKAFDALNTDAQALVQNIDILEQAEQDFNAIMDRIKNVIQLMNALPGYDEVQLSDEAQIQAVRDAFNALSPEEQNAIPNIQVSMLESAELKIQLLKDNAAEVAIAEDLVQRITVLESVVVDYSHETEIKAIREAYDKLTAPAQLLVVNYNEFLAIELELTHVYESIIYVDGLIEALPDTIEYSHKNQVEYVKAKYDDLGTENQAGVKAENVTKLGDAVAEIERLEQLKQQILQTNVEVQAVVSEIEQLPAVASITIDDKDQVMGAVARFRMLPEDVQFAVDTTPLEEAFDRVETLMAEEVVALIDALPSIDDLNLTHATLLAEVRAKYDEISTRNNMKVTNINKLTELEVKMLELTNANPTIIEIVNKIKDLDDVVTFDNFDDIDIKIKEIEALMETVDRSDFYLITNFEKYDDVSYQLETLRRVYHVTTGAEVVELINILPDDLKYVQMSTREAIEDARNAYTKISDSEKLLVDNLAKLEAVEAELKRIEDGINEVYSAIHRIPDLKDLTLADRHLVEEARRMYDAADVRVQHYINHMNIGDLLNAEIKIEKLENGTI